MSPDERCALEALQQPPLDDEGDANVMDDLNIDSILDGSEPLEMSHAGGEFEASTRNLLNVYVFISKSTTYYYAHFNQIFSTTTTPTRPSHMSRPN